jgi:hypothetical protein
MHSLHYLLKYYSLKVQVMGVNQEQTRFRNGVRPQRRAVGGATVSGAEWSFGMVKQLKEEHRAMMMMILKLLLQLLLPHL